MGQTVIFGGTFNPFHIGHAAMLSALCALPQADSVWLMPDRVPPHKTCDFLAPEDDRIEMCRLAAGEFEKASVCLIEFERPGKSYTSDTVLALKARYPETDFRLACGGDMIATLDTWHDWRRLIAEVGFYAFRRVGTPDFDKNVGRLRALGAQITALDTPVPAVSSTEIRRALGAGLPTPLIPPRIDQYIRERNVYFEHGNTGVPGI